MKQFKIKIAIFCILLFAAVSAVIFSGCSASGGSDTVSSEAPSEHTGSGSISTDESSAVDEKDFSSKQLNIDPKAPLPLENNQYRTAGLDNFKTIGAQLYTDTGEEPIRSIPYNIAAAIMNYRDYRNTLIFSENFNDITKLEIPILVEIAASQAPHIDLYSNTFDQVSAENPIKRFYTEQETGGNDVSLISYGNDVRKKAKQLFGDDFELPKQNGISILYHPELDIYYLDGDGSSMSTDYPILVNWKQVDSTTYTASIIRMAYWDFVESWSTIDGSWESGRSCNIEELREFVNTNFHSFPQQTYTLTGSDSKALRVTGFKNT